MKRKPFILVAFLLCLYLSPTFVSAASWHEVTSADLEFDTPGWYNVTSAELEFLTPEPPSDQSITSFYETLPKDELFYPDTFSKTSFATGGDSGYENTYAVDGSYFSSPLGDEILEFHVDNTSITGIEYFSYAVYGSSPDETHLYYADADDPPWTEWFVGLDEPTLEWYNGTEYNVETLSDIAASETFFIYFDFASNIDYIEITFYYLILGENSYAESFVDISDWTKVFNSNTTATSDYDVVSFDWNWDGAGTDYLSFYTDVPSLDTSSGDYYVEIRHSSTITSASKGFHLLLYDEDGMGGSAQQMNNLNTVTGWMTTKLRVTVDLIESIRIYAVFASAANPFDTNIDYLRIARSNELGWQHDGSTLEGWTYGDSASSDGDKITFTNIGGGAHAQYVRIDNTVTSSKMDTDDYQFVEWSITNVTDDGDGNVWLLRAYEGSGDYTNLPPTETAYSDATGIFRANIECVQDEIEYFLFYTQDADDSFTLDYIHMYSIANWSYYAPSATTGDYFYTAAGILYSEKSSNAYQQLTYDIELSTNTTIFEFANISTGVWTGTGDYSYGFDYDVGAGWEGYTYDETLVALDAGTLEAIRIIVKDSGAISAISFTDPLSLWWEAALAELMFRVKFWVDVVTAILKVLVELYGFGWFFILAGLVMIPTSTLFLVRGGKDDMSRDKLFLFFLIFLFGWAFVIGGLM